MATHKLAILVEAIGAAKAARDLKGVDQSISNIGGHAGRGIRNAAGNLVKLGAVAGTVVVGGLAGAAKAAIDWEDAFQGVVKTVDEKELTAAGSSFEQLGDDIRAMARDMPNTAIELAGIAEQAGALGVKADDIDEFTRQVAILASTTNVTADEAATALGQLGNVIGLTGDDYDNFAAALVDLGNKGASTEAEILEITRRAGGAAKLIGLAKDATLGWSSAAANLGLNPELAGTALQNFYLKTQMVVGKGGDSLKTFAQIAGQSAKDFKRAWKKDASGALESFVKGLSKLPKEKRLEVVQKFFGKGSGLTRLILGLAGDVDNLSSSLDTSAQAWTDATAAQAEFDKRNATVKSAFQRLRNNITDAAITLGEGFAPALGRAADKLSDFLKVPENRQAIKKLGEDIGRFVDDVDWKGLISDARSFMSALEKAGGFAKGLIDTFMSMPAEAKAVLLSLAGLNKLTGGAVGSIVGELGKGLIKGVLNTNVGVMNVNAGTVNGLGGGTGAAGAAGSAAPGMAGFLGAAGIGAIGIAIGTGMNEVASTITSSVLKTDDPDTQARLDIMARNLSPLQQLATAVANIGKLPGQIADLLAPKPGATTADANAGGSAMAGWAAGREAWKPVVKQVDMLEKSAVPAIDGVKDKTDKVLGKMPVLDRSIQAARDAARTAGSQTSNAATSGASRVTTQSIANTGRLVGAISAARPIVSTKVNVYVTAGSVTSSQTTEYRYGSTTGSRSNDGYNDSGK